MQGKLRAIAMQGKIGAIALGEDKGDRWSEISDYLV